MSNSFQDILWDTETKRPYTKWKQGTPLTQQQLGQGTTHWQLMIDNHGQAKQSVHQNFLHRMDAISIQRVSL